MIIRLSAILVLGLALVAPAIAQIGDTRSFVPRVMPADASKRDTRYIGIYDSCGESGGLQQPVVLAPVAGSPTLRKLALRTNASEDDFFCFATTPMPFTRRLFLVELPPDADPLILAVDVTISDRDGSAISEHRVTVPRQMTDVAPPSIAGTWNSPAHVGQGVHVSFSPLPIGEADGVTYHADGLVVVWATYEPDGDPIVLTGNGRLGRPSYYGYVTRLELVRTRGGTFPGRSGGSATAEPWGTVDLEYLGCGELRMTWSANDKSAYPDGSMELSQLIHTSTAACDLERFAFQRAQRVEVIVPQIAALPAK